MKNAIFAVVLVLVAAVSYGVGRRHRIAPSETPPARATNAYTPQVEVPGVPAARVAAPIPVQQADPATPFAQNLTAAQRGYEMARLNLDAALKEIELLPVSERMGFITGVFSFVAQNRPPTDALKVYQDLPQAHKANALRALVAEWIYSRSPLEADQRYLKREGTLTISGSRLGLEVELTSMLASTQPDAELISAWIEAFSNHSGRSEIFSILSGRVAFHDPDSMLARTETWTSWEKERAAKSFLANWSYGAPQEAWNWYQSRRDRFDQDFTGSILAPWASSDPEGAKRALNTVEDPAQRQAAISAIGKVLAEKNTDEALAWAEGIPDPKERALAHQAVYDGAPRGIGAVLDFEQGLPKLRGIVPGSPLDGTGAQAGDRIVEVRESDGKNHALYGRDIQTAVNTIRGDAGTQMTLRVLRQNTASGKLEEHLIPVTRGQLYLNEKLIPKPPGG